MDKAVFRTTVRMFAPDFAATGSEPNALASVFFGNAPGCIPGTSLPQTIAPTGCPRATPAWRADLAPLDFRLRVGQAQPSPPGELPKTIILKNF